MSDEAKLERCTIHVFDLDQKTGEVLVRELHVVRDGASKQGRTSIVSIDLSKALEKLGRFDEGRAAPRR